MTVLALLAVAALVFSILAGVMEGMVARRARRRFQRRSLPALHPFPHHGVVRRVREPLYWRALHHIGLFLGFLAVTYVGVLALRWAHTVIDRWF